MAPAEPSLATLLRQSGPILFGSSWQSEMARYLGVSDRTVRRWVAGTDVPGAWVRDRLLQRSAEKRQQLAAALEACGQAEGFRA